MRLKLLASFGAGVTVGVSLIVLLIDGGESAPEVIANALAIATFFSAALWLTMAAVKSVRDWFREP